MSWVTSPSAMPPPVPCVLQAMSVLSKTKMSGEVSKMNAYFRVQSDDWLLDGFVLHTSYINC